MGTTADKLQYLIDAKNSISAAIEEKGGTVPQELSGYGDAITNLPDPHDSYTNVNYKISDSAVVSALISITGTANSISFPIPLSAEYVGFGDPVVGIGSSLFYNSTNLKSVEFGERSELSIIGTSSFYGCSKLASFDCPNTLRRIVNQTFINCTKLSSVVLNEGLSAIGSASFRGCSNLSAIEFPNSLSSIGNNCFRSSGLIEVSLPSSLTALEGSLFFECPNLSAVTIPNTITSMGGSIFYGCGKLLTLTIPSSVQSIGSSALQLGTASALPTITFEGKTMAEVQGMANYPWGARPGSQFVCTDGTITR